MRLILPVLALGAALILAGCANSGSVSPLVFCDRPSDFNAKVFTDCTPRIGGDSPWKRDQQDRHYDDDTYFRRHR
jgi:hypothetical protein